MMKAYTMMGDTLKADSMAKIILTKEVKVPSVEVEMIKARAMERVGR